MELYVKNKLTTLWVFAVLNYLYCDLVGLMDAGMLSQYLSGTVGGMQMTEAFLLGASVLMEISMGMVVVSHLTPYKFNRVANIVSGTIVTLVQAATLFMPPHASYYIFFSVIEIATTLTIVILAIRWKDQPQSVPNLAAQLDG
jgi:hypothetical protein